MRKTDSNMLYLHPKDISIYNYTYYLPPEKIANYPLTERDASKLLIYKNGRISEDTYKNIHHHIAAGTLLIFNNTKVIEARLIFEKPTGGRVEIFCLEPHSQYYDISTALSQNGQVMWMCLIGRSSKWKRGQSLEKKIISGSSEINLIATYQGKENDKFLINLAWTPSNLTFGEVLHHAGATPLPPYIKRPAETSDIERYQTVYAKAEGSVAAPTAGLHFTIDLLREIRAKNITIDFLTLHVGTGTFQPVKSETMEQHQIHAEYMEVSRQTIQHLLDFDESPVVAIGTTSLRTLESLFWIGVMIKRNSFSPAKEISINQWDVYEVDSTGITVKDSLQSVLNYLDEKKLQRLITKTQLLIAPGYEFKIVDGLITNFHQPQSTLLLLVAAFIGDDWKMIYNHALENEYRFLSYGDGCLLFRK